MAKKIEDLTFIDDGMFQAVMHDPEICTELVERLLHVKVQKVAYPELEKQIAPYYSTKGVRLDVYLKDENKVIDVEVQTYEQEAIGKRTRYYQSMIDMDTLMKGQDYQELLDSYILFICNYDPFKNADGVRYGQPCYTFKNTCKENAAVDLDDKSVKVIYNSTAYEEVEDEKVRAFLHFINTNEPGEDDFSNKLAALVEKLKDNEKFRSNYAAMNLHDRDIMRIARKEGAEENARENAINFYKNGVSIEVIAKSMNKTIEEVQNIVSSKD